MHPVQETINQITRRHFFSQGSHAVGWAALSSLLAQEGVKQAVAGESETTSQVGAIARHYAPKAEHVIFLNMVGGPSQMDLFDYKPVMKDWYDKDLPESIRKGQRLTTMSSGQKRFPIAPSIFKFAQHGESRMWVSELLPYTAKMVDDMCFIRTMHTDAINHDPAITFLQSGNQNTGRPCLGAWTSYGLGSLNENLPTFVVQVAKPTNTESMQAISAKHWSSGYLPGKHAGVNFRSAGAPILYINNPPGVPPEIRRRTLDGLNELNEMTFEKLGDPETRTRIQQYELAYRMQTSVPELTDLSKESASTFELYGDSAKVPGTFGYTALQARRLVERGVRFVQIYHNNWDSHGKLVSRLPGQCKDVDQPCWGLVQDLKQRGLLNKTLVIWGGEFGRTIYTQGRLSKENYGRDHHPRCFTMWMAGGGSRPGTVYGETDDFSYNIAKDPVHVHDFHATVLRLLGYDHERCLFKYQGLDQRLTGVEPCKVIDALMT